MMFGLDVNYFRVLRFIPAPARRLLGRAIGGSVAQRKLDHYNTDFPKVINVSFMEKTCMFRCTMCPYHEQDVRDLYRHSHEMSFETLKNLVAGVPDREDITFDISGIGETLEFKPVADFIAYMKRERPRVQTVISTNILLLDEAMFRALAASGLDHIQLSLYAQNAADHIAITGSRSYERCVENIKNAARVKKELGLTKPRLRVFMMESQESQALVEEFKRYWSDIVDEAFARPIYNVAHKVEGMTPLFTPIDWDRRYPCVTPWYSVAVRSNGDVLGCYIFHWDKESKEIVVGNVNEKPLGEIYQGEAARHLREAQLEQRFESYKACQTCDLWAAYTDVFEKPADGPYRYAPIRPRDFFRQAPQRGG